MTLDPDAQRVLEMAKASTAPLYEQVDPQTARDLYRKGRRVLQPAPQPIAATRDLEIPGPAGAIPARAYYPVAPEGRALPVLVYYHGGGWVIGDLDTHDGVCRHLANASSCAVVSVDYRLSPEAKFPAAVEDSHAALAWIAREGRALHLDTDRVAVGGDSAGGNLSAVMALLARERGPRIGYQLLFYPATDFDMNFPSQERLAEGYLLTRSNQHWFQNHYLASDSDRADWRASPLKASSLAGLPPAYVLIAGYDPLCDEGQAYADALKAAGVPVTVRHFPGQIHGFLTMGGVIKESAVALDEAGAALRQALGAA